jgi:glycosyltransferase involved in cell wall biosynthesis
LTKKTLLFFGLIREYKGLDLLLEAFSELDDSFQLIIAGEVYGERSLYDALIQQSKNKHIFFADHFISNDEVASYFSAADLCLLPYRSATQSGIKAMCDAFHVPVLVSPVGGLSEEMMDNENGFIIHEMNPSSLASQINELFQGDRLQKVANNIRQQLEKEENEWDEFAELVLKFAALIQQTKKSH